MKTNLNKTTHSLYNIFSQKDEPDEQNFLNYLNLINPSNHSPMYHNPPEPTRQQTNQPAKIKKDK
jgi:hypothetical protein